MDKPKILSVDDEANFTDMLKQYFEPRGYEIDTASNGETGIEMLKLKKYDVALLDFKMVGLNGDEVMGCIKDVSPGTTIIFITAFSDSGKTRQSLIDKGAYAFMEKPVASLKNLEELVNQAANTVRRSE
ncbi:MAG: response regulator [Candidatus Omnitrophica bacterium]|nr:response regulator [Candidatus Omnitrophota bacterium]